MSINFVHLYTGPHKGQRRYLFKVSTLAGTIDFTDKTALDDLYKETRMMKEKHLEHAGSEEKYIHPMLAQRVPGITIRLEADHREQERQLNELLSHLEGTRSSSPDPGNRNVLGLEFYRALNRFISFYLTHIDYEEEHVQPTLWAVCSSEELMGAMRSVLTNQSPEQGMWWLSAMLPAMNLSERVALLSAARNMMPPAVFQSQLDFISTLLSKEDWAAVKSRMGLDK